MRLVSGFLLSVLASLPLLGSSPEAVADSKTPAADKLVASAETIAAEVSKLRGLTLKRKISSGVMSKAQIKARILKLLHEEYTDAELDAESLAMKRFGLLPEKSDYVKLMVGLLEDQIAGFYDPGEKRLYIAGWAPMGGEMLMAHEIDHALQDQHFDLKKFMTPNRRNGDSMAARQALVEGDGMALMLEFQMAAMKQAPPWGNALVMQMLKKGMAKGMGAMKHVPLALREGLIFPYVGGLEFVAHFRKDQPWSRIDKIYSKPPLSTEQILHPEKYQSYEKPLVVTASKPASLQGYKERVSSVYGEKGIELFLRTHGVELSRAVTAAKGWGGDRMAVYAKHTHKGSQLRGTIGVALSAWDHQSDAQEFMEALEHALPTLAGSTAVKRGDKVLQFDTAQGRLRAERKGAQVQLLIGAPAATSEALAQELWQSWTVKAAK